MARESEISTSFKPLHNFALPDGLRWGNQKFLKRRPSSSVSTRLSNNANRFPPPGLRKRKEVEEFIDQPQSPAPSDDRRGSNFMKSDFNFKIPPAPSTHYTEFGQKFKAIKSGDGREEDGIAAVREKLMFDLQTEADKMKDAILRDGFETEDQVDDNNHNSPAPPVNTRPTVASPSDSIPPWNLRTRRAACKAPQPPNGAGTGSLDVGGQGLNSDAMIPDLKSSPEENKAARPRSSGATPSIEKKERAKFSVALTKHEIEEDFLAFAGRRPPRRPHKRPKHVQKVLETLFPGFWLTEITADMYKVVEMP